MIILELFICTSKRNVNLISLLVYNNYLIFQISNYPHTSDVKIWCNFQYCLSQYTFAVMYLMYYMNVSHHVLHDCISLALYIPCIDMNGCYMYLLLVVMCITCLTNVSLFQCVLCMHANKTNFQKWTIKLNWIELNWNEENLWLIWMMK